MSLISKISGQIKAQKSQSMNSCVAYKKYIKKQIILEI